MNGKWRHPLVGGFSHGAIAVLTVLLATGLGQTVAAAGSAPFHAVTFLENDTPLDQVFSSLTANMATDLTTFANLNPTFSNPGFTFLDWNTAADGSGTSYADGASYSFVAPIQLFAIWTPLSAQADFDANGGTGITAAIDTSVGDSIQLPPSEGFTRSGFTFSDWNTEANGGGTSYAPGASFLVAQNVTLYAQWTAVNVYVITLSANGASGSQIALHGNEGTQVTLPGQGGFIKPGFHLVRWNTKGNGNGVSYAIGQQINLTASLTLYAQWVGHTPPVLLNAIGSFAKGSSKMSATLKRQVERVASAVKAHHYRLVTLFGYSAATGLVSFDVSLSRSRGVAVAKQLRSDLVRLHVTGVRITSAGEGSLPGESTPAFSRVEVFVS